MIYPTPVRPDMLALFLLKKTSRVLNVLSKGTNHPKYIQNQGKLNTKKNLSSINKSIHAEEMALDKIKGNNRKSNLTVSLMVIRITEKSTECSYKLCNSKPCISCICKIMNISCSGYKVSKIYFSNENGEIVCFKFKEILKESPHISKYYKNTTLPKALIKEFHLCEKNN